ncbi:MAG TPA: PilZ domain-containing protein [Pirellulales bacterium]|jgi:hypothetical protein|nr:PilZ domain-containing protein [Pirellulales bacterium]
MIESERSSTGLVGCPEEERLQSAVNQLLSTYLPPPDAELRKADRWPFFAPVSLSFEGDAFPRYSAFAHDISFQGIGLLHVMPLEPCEVIVTIGRATGGALSIRTQMIWCKSYGEVWYKSGGRFLEVVQS